MDVKPSKVDIVWKNPKHDYKSNPEGGRQREYYRIKMPVTADKRIEVVFRESALREGFSKAIGWEIQESEFRKALDFLSEKLLLPVMHRVLIEGAALGVAMEKEKIIYESL